MKDMESGYLERLFSCKKFQHNLMPRNQWGDYCQTELEEVKQWGSKTILGLTGEDYK